MNELLTSLIRDARVWQGHRHPQARVPAESTGYPALDRQLGGQGWPRGALSECLLDTAGIGELQLVLPLIQRTAAADRLVFWVNPPHIPYAPALHREGVDLDQMILIRTRDCTDFLWTLENCLRSPVTGLVLAWPGALADRDLRRLQLAAEAGDNICILFRPRRHARQSSPAALRLELVPGPHQDLQIHPRKRRGGWPGQPCTFFPWQKTGLPETEPGWFVQGPWPREP